MKIINEYRFKNKKIITASFVSKKERKNMKIPNCDCLYFEFQSGLTMTYVYLRPDEALLIAKQLIDAVYKVTGAYEEKLLKGYYGYKENSL